VKFHQPGITGFVVHNQDAFLPSFHRRFYFPTHVVTSTLSATSEDAFPSVRHAKSWRCRSGALEGHRLEQGLFRPLARGIIGANQQLADETLEEHNPELPF
jgi:hypothetical protein